MRAHPARRQGLPAPRFTAQRCIRPSLSKLKACSLRRERFHRADTPHRLQRALCDRSCRSAS